MYFDATTYQKVLSLISTLTMPSHNTAYVMLADEFCVFKAPLEENIIQLWRLSTRPNIQAQPVFFSTLSAAGGFPVTAAAAAAATAPASVAYGSGVNVSGQAV